jgi:hypothetical protein
MLSLLGSNIIDTLLNSFALFLNTYFIWLPIILGFIFMELWLYYVRSDYVTQQGEVLLEIRLPTEVTKSPLAMEIFLTALFQTGSATYLETYIKGKVRPFFSLELVSLEGKIHFYIWCQPKFRDFIEAQLYAQYPDIEITEAIDYAKLVKFDREKMVMWGTYFKYQLKPEEGGDFIPIKSYVDFALDKASEKEEFKTDPMASTLEFLGSIGKGEQVWFQIIIQAHKKLTIREGHAVTQDEWKKAATKYVKKLREEAVHKYTDVDDKERQIPNPTKMQSELIGALERKISKWPFEVGMRGMYIATIEANKIALRVPGVINNYRQYGANSYYNNIKIGKFTDFDDPWEDFMRIRRTERERKMLDAYKRRSFFQYPYKFWLQNYILLSTEELATIWHFPGQVVRTPNLDRIPSKKSDAPSNLPI